YVIVVDGDRIGEPVVANPAVDVLRARAEVELGRMHADHDQAELGVIAVPRLDVGRGSDPVDAGVLPEVDQDHLAAHRFGGERRGVHPAVRLEGGYLAGRGGEGRIGGSAKKQERHDDRLEELISGLFVPTAVVDWAGHTSLSNVS